MKKVISLFLALMMLLSITSGVQFSVYASDDFTEIRTVSDLYKIRFNLDGNYILMNDIDLTEATSENGDWSYNGHGWNPIGSSDIYSNQEAFTGVFEGNGHKIIGLTMTPYVPDGSTDHYVALFANNAGCIRNLTMDSFNIEAKSYTYTSSSGSYSYINYYVSYTAAIVALNSGEIINCKALNGNIYARVDTKSDSSFGSTPTMYLSGICGKNEGMIKYCDSNTTFTCANTSWTSSSNGPGGGNYYIGGICVNNDSNIMYCSDNSNFVENKVYTGKTNYVNWSVGGITYKNNGIINDCYSYNDNKSRDLSNNGTGKINNSYTHSNNSMICYQGINTDCYYLSNGKSQSGCTPLTEEQMKMDFMYQGFDFDNVWYIDENSDYPYPQLRIPNTKTVEKITIKKQPKKAVYVTNEAIDAAEGILNVKYIDGTFEDVPMKEYMLSGYDMATAGTQTVTVTYEDKTATFDILVKDEANIDSLVIQSQPNKTTFVKATKFDFTGCVARINYTDTTYDDIYITVDMTSGGDINTVGTQTISYSVGGKTATFDIEVVPVVMDRIFVASAPDKVNYLPDEELDTTGLVVKAEYNNGNIKEITNYTISGFGDTNEINPITVSYDGKETTFNVTIHTPYEEWTTITEASCTVQGEKVKYCKTCGNVVIRDVVEPKGHTPVTDEAIANTCTKIGLTEGSHCSVCGTVLTAQQVINAKGHSYTSKVTKTATCSSKGIRTYTCTTCGDTYTTELEMVAHTPVTDAAVAANCTNSGLTAGSHCSVCGTVLTVQEVVKATGHSYKAVVTEPTCASKGYTTYTCETCGDSFKSKYTDKTDAHNYVAKVTTPASCTKTGVKTFTCSVCGDSYTEVIPLTEHTAVVDKAVTPTCEKSGLTEGSHCSVCGTVLTAQEVVKATGHSYKAEIIENSSCTENGLMKHTCEICGDSYTTVIEKTGHTEVIDEAIKPDCTHSGLSEGSHCSVCGEIIVEQTVIEPLNHSWNEGSVIKESTAKETGEIVYTCTECGETYSEELPALTGWIKENGVWYYNDSEGKSLTGWQKISNVWYYFNAEGEMQTGWQKIGSTWYYFKSGGAMVTGWQKIGSTWYYFKSGGAMVTGWQKISNKWYYFESSGAMRTANLRYKGKTYRFNSSGACLNP